MKRKNVKGMLALLLAAGTVLTACGQSAGTEGSTEKTVADTTKGTVKSEAAEVSAEQKNSDEVVTLSLYPANANLTSGLVTGHRADYFAENGFELEVWAYSDEKTNAILASGDLPDIMYVQKGDMLDTMIESGMVLKLDDYLDRLSHLNSTQYMQGALDILRKNNSAGTGELYALPVSVGEAESVGAWADSTDRNTVKLRWDVYEEIGAPEIKDYDELIDVMEQMVAAHPEEEDGTKCYGMFLDNGLDSTYFGAMMLWYRWQGYTEAYLPYMLETNMVTGEYNSILSKDSLYYKGLKWYNEVYRRGLMDPESINTDRGTQAKKVDAGLAMVPSGTLPGWATKYYEYYIPKTNIYFDNIQENGDVNYVIVVNANTEYLDACLNLLDMWCNPDAYLRVEFGPEGDIWETDGDNAYLTENYLNWLKAGNGSYNGYPMSDGTEMALWNTGFCVGLGVETSYGDGQGNKRRVAINKWTEGQEITTDNSNFEAWKKTMGYDTWMDLLEDKGAYYSSSPVSEYQAYMGTPDDSMQLVIDSLKDIVVTSSWKMVYAKDDAAFDEIWDQMIKDCEGLDAQSVIDWKLSDIENAKKLAKQ